MQQYNKDASRIFSSLLATNLLYTYIRIADAKLKVAGHGNQLTTNMIDLFHA